MFMLIFISHQGGGLLVIAFSDESPLRNDAQYFVTFEGSYLRHLVTALQVNHVTFHSHIPGKKDFSQCFFLFLLDNPVEPVNVTTCLSGLSILKDF